MRWPDLAPLARCDADPEVLSDYVLALLRHDASDGDLQNLLKEQLDDFLAESEYRVRSGEGRTGNGLLMPPLAACRDVWLRQQDNECAQVTELPACIDALLCLGPT